MLEDALLNMITIQIYSYGQLLHMGIILSMCSGHYFTEMHPPRVVYMTHSAEMDSLQ